MKYTVINHTTLEIIETDNITVAYKWTNDWAVMNYDVEIVDNVSDEIVVDIRRENWIMKKWYEIQTKYYTFPFFMLPLYPIAWIREKIIENRGWQTSTPMI